jgi:hypothetical protein
MSAADLQSIDHAVNLTHARRTCVRFGRCHRKLREVR